jgi:hypothetical protein
MIDRRALLSASLLVPLVARASASAAGDYAPNSLHTGTRTMATPAFQRIELHIRFRTQRDGKSFERGHETASYVFNEDGRITFCASSRSDEPRITRDVIYTLGRDYRPLEAFVRLQVDGRYEGSGWFRFEADSASSETFNHKTGRQSQVTRLTAPVQAFVSHPVTTDVMLAAACDKSRRFRQPLVGVFTSSADPFGRVGPSLSPSLNLSLEYAGRESLETLAGRFEADRYALFTGLAAKEPVETMWTLADTCVFVHARAGGPFNTEYELVEFRAT